MSAFAIRPLFGLAVAALVLGPAVAAPEVGAADNGSRYVRSELEERVMPEIPAGDPLISEDQATDQKPDGTGPVVAPQVEYDPARLPPAVRRLREQIIEAAATGDPENLRPIIDANGEPPAFSYNDTGDDPVEYLKSLSADPEGREILAILIDMLKAGYVHIGVGTPDEMYVWPYFAYYPVQLLTGPQIVELLEIVYPGDYEDMKTYGVYLSYRVGLSPDGTWRYFLVGD